MKQINHLQKKCLIPVTSGDLKIEIRDTTVHTILEINGNNGKNPMEINKDLNKFQEIRISERVFYINLCLFLLKVKKRLNVKLYISILLLLGIYITMSNICKKCKEKSIFSENCIKTNLMENNAFTIIFQTYNSEK